MIYKDRNEAATLLAKELVHLRGEDGVVTAIPRGGLPIGFVIARHLGFPLEVVLVKKIGHPVDREYALGSASLESVVVGKYPDVPESYVQEETSRLRKLLKDRDEMYHKDYPAIALTGKTVVLTDDGIATGRTLLAAIDLIRLQRPRKLIVAIPVAPPTIIPTLERLADEVVCLQAPEHCRAVSQFYYNFQQVSDANAVKYLNESRKPNSKKYHER